MSTIILKNHVNDTSSNMSGYQLYAILKNFILKNQTIEIDLIDSLAISSSFFNSSFGELIENYGFYNVVKLLKFKNITANQKVLLKSYFDSYKETSKY